MPTRPLHVPLESRAAPSANGASTHGPVPMGTDSVGGATAGNGRAQSVPLTRASFRRRSTRTYSAYTSAMATSRRPRERFGCASSWMRPTPGSSRPAVTPWRSFDLARLPGCNARSRAAASSLSCTRAIGRACFLSTAQTENMSDQSSSSAGKPSSSAAVARTSSGDSSTATAVASLRMTAGLGACVTTSPTDLRTSSVCTATASMPWESVGRAPVTSRSPSTGRPPLPSSRSSSGRSDNGANPFESGYCVPMADTVLIHPNRDKAESKATRVGVILLLLASAGLILVITLGGWSQLQGAQPVSFAYVIVYVGMALFVARWNRGVLPVAAALAIRGFQQQWNVEVEVPRDEAERYRRGDREPGQVQPA